MLEINEILEYLSSCEAYRPSKNKNRTQEAADFFAKWSVIIGLALFGVLCLVFLVHKFGPQLPRWLLETALVSYLISSLLMVFSMVAVIVSEIASFCKLRGVQNGRKTNDPSVALPIDPEIETDEKYVTKLVDYDPSVLKYAQRYLQLKVARMDRQISLFFGEKVALVSLFIFASTQVEKVGGTAAIGTMFEHWTEPAHYLDTALIAALALGAGLALGSLGLKFSQRRYVYRLDLLDIALLRQTLVKDIRDKHSEGRRGRQPE